MRKSQSIDKRSVLNPAAGFTPHAIQATDGVTVKDTPMNRLKRARAVGEEMKALASEALASGDAEAFAALAEAGFDVTLVDPYDARQNLGDVLEAWLFAPIWDRLEEWNANLEPIWQDVAFGVFLDVRTDLHIAKEIDDEFPSDLSRALYDHFTENESVREDYEEAGAIDLFNAKLKLLEGGGGEEDHDADESDEEVEHVPGCREQGAHEEVRTGEGGALCAAIDQDKVGNLALAAFIDSTWPVVRDQITAGEAEA